MASAAGSRVARRRYSLGFATDVEQSLFQLEHEENVEQKGTTVAILSQAKC